jgi:hypothetical protein
MVGGLYGLYGMSYHVLREIFKNWSFAAGVISFNHVCMGSKVSNIVFLSWYLVHYVKC